MWKSNLLLTSLGILTQENKRTIMNTDYCMKAKNKKLPWLNKPLISILSWKNLFLVINNTDWLNNFMEGRAIDVDSAISAVILVVLKSIQLR